MDKNNSQKITFDEYINNPMGKENTVFSHRDMYANLYKEKLDKILVRENAHIDYKLYIDKNKEAYYVYIKVPSEVIENFYYDVVIQMTPKDSNFAMQRNLKNYKVRFFSNDPSFVFTFVHAFYKKDLFIKDLSSKMTKEALKEVGKEKNPEDQIGYVKSLYFAYLIMKQKGLFEKVKFESEGEPINWKKLLSQIEHADSKINERQEEQTKLNKHKKAEKKKDQDEYNKGRNEKLNAVSNDKKRQNGLSINNIKNIANSKTSNRVNVKNRIKRTKSI